MTRRIALLPFLLAGLLTAPAAAGVSGFSIVNQTGSALSAVAVRRVGGSAWTPLSAAPAAGATAAISFDDPDCAFDLRGTVAGAGPAVWRVNLCDAKSVTLNRDKSGHTWVDYD